MSYVQVVMGRSLRIVNTPVRNKQADNKVRAKTVDRVSINQGKLINLEVESSGDKEGVNNTRHNREEIIEFSPLKEENQWLKGSMIAVVKSMSMISTIQERVDVDGGLINLSPLGGRSLLLTDRLEGYLSEYM
ncbi:hypothetical protein SLEP1_g26893 [Rubroshorea leprosula]|uniref:Uncharacterized protein n=1 Tax=Rubroshorea leprosula TaxID=152421 RepID=A0AAV5JYA7_9ROSI|nr:hypothetical protein SLEP1_g26893 [Rubroshorea leprosula]